MSTDSTRPSHKEAGLANAQAVLARKLNSDVSLEAAEGEIHQAVLDITGANGPKVIVGPLRQWRASSDNLGSFGHYESALSEDSVIEQYPVQIVEEDPRLNEREAFKKYEVRERVFEESKNGVLTLQRETLKQMPFFISVDKSSARKIRKRLFGAISGLDYLNVGMRTPGQELIKAYVRQQLRGLGKGWEAQELTTVAEELTRHYLEQLAQANAPERTRRERE